MLRQSDKIQHSYTARTSFFLINTDENGRNETIYVNRPELRNALTRFDVVSGNPGVAVSSDGREIHVPNLPGPASWPGGAVQTESSLPNPAGGLIYRMISQRAYSMGDVLVGLPCDNAQTHMVGAGDGLWFYQGGWSSAAPNWTNQVETGLGYDILGTTGGQHTWTPYLKVDWAKTYYVSTQNPTYYVCNPPELYVLFESNGGVDSSNHAWEDFTNHTCAGNFYTSTLIDCVFNAETIDIVLHVTSSTVGSKSVRGWNTSCTDCAVQLAAAIAQQVQGAKTGSTFLVQWPFSDVYKNGGGVPPAMVGGAWAQSSTLDCQKYPPWPTDVCATGPKYPYDIAPAVIQFGNPNQDGFEYEDQWVELQTASP
jgi:hypothetical protein